VETNFQSRFSVIVWYGVMDDMLIGTVILDDHMTGHKHLDFLQNGLPEQPEDVPLAIRIALFFQNDGATSHYTFPNRWDWSWQYH
jgi:hypothetical protein